MRRGSAAALVVASTPALLPTSAAAAPTTAELRRRLRGTLVTPRDDGWDVARALYNPRLDVSPRAIAFCESTPDVAHVVRFARARGWPVAARGGRHSFAGYSNAPGGSVARCSEDRRGDLFWALRGAGAGTAIVTQLRFAVRAAAQEAIAFTFSYPWTQAAAAIDAWQRTLPSAPVTLSYGRLRALRRPDGALTLTASGHWYDTETKLRGLLAPLAAAGPARQTVRRRTFAQAALPDGVQLREGGPVVGDRPARRCARTRPALPSRTTSIRSSRTGNGPTTGPTRHGCGRSSGATTRAGGWASRRGE